MNPINFSKDPWLVHLHQTAAPLKKGRYIVLQQSNPQAKGPVRVGKTVDGIPYYALMDRKLDEGHNGVVFQLNVFKFAPSEKGFKPYVVKLIKDDGFFAKLFRWMSSQPKRFDTLFQQAKAEYAAMKYLCFGEKKEALQGVVEAPLGRIEKPKGLLKGAPYSFELIIPYYNAGNLATSIQQKRLSANEKELIAKDLIRGQLFFLRKNTFHPDIKTLNVLLEKNLEGHITGARLCDLGGCMVGSSKLCRSDLGLDEIATEFRDWIVKIKQVPWHVDPAVIEENEKIALNALESKEPDSSKVDTLLSCYQNILGSAQKISTLCLAAVIFNLYFDQPLDIDEFLSNPLERDRAKRLIAEEGSPVPSWLKAPLSQMFETSFNWEDFSKTAFNV